MTTTEPTADRVSTDPAGDLFDRVDVWATAEGLDTVDTMLLLTRAVEWQLRARVGLPYRLADLEGLADVVTDWCAGHHVPADAEGQRRTIEALSHVLLRLASERLGP